MVPIKRLFSPPRIAIFQAHWRLHSSVVYLALLLSKEGYAVDVFLLHVDELGQEGVLDSAEHVCIYRISHRDKLGVWISQLDNEGTQSFWRAGIRRVTQFGLRAIRFIQHRVGGHRNEIYSLRSEFVRDETELATPRINRRILRRMRWKAYAATIAVDKGGIAWAGPIMETCRSVPVIYYSLELYTRDHWMCNIPYMARLKVLEERYYPSCRGTIIQDAARAEVLFEDNQISSMHVAYVPISRTGPEIRERSNWLRTQFHLTPDIKIILVYGMISVTRLSPELSQLAQFFPPNWKLVFHGQGSEAVRQRISETDRLGRTLVSSAIVPMNEEPNVVASADVSIVLYGDTNKNDFLTGFSSEKLALSLQCGVPVIAFNYPTNSHIKAEGCGVLIDAIDEIPEAIEKTLNEYSSYRENAFAVFERYYRYEYNFPAVLNLLKNVATH
jgi:glycosyltransferase involved in cell wall biosynthesis